MAQFAAPSQRAAAVESAVANPAPLGLCAFALTTFVLSCTNAGFLVPATGAGVVAGLALFYGGLAQLLAGMWEFRAGNTFGGTAFSSYGGFWMAFGVILIPATGVANAIPASVVHQALGVFLLGWTIFTAMMLIGSLRTNLALVALFAFLTLTFLALTIAELGGGAPFQQIGGWLGIITALIAWYTALAGVLSSSKSMFTLPVMPRD